MINFEIQTSQHSKALLQFAYSFTRDIVNAEDLYQDTMLKAYSCFYQYQPNTNLKSWLFTIMKNIFINQYRRNKRRSGVVTVKDEFTQSDLSSGCTKNRAEETFVLGDVNKVLAKLPRIYADPFVMYFEGYKYQEIAEKLKTPIGTVKTRIHLAREILKKKLKAYS